MSQHNTEFYPQDNEDFYQSETQQREFFDLEQVNQFQPELRAAQHDDDHNRPLRLRPKRVQSLSRARRPR